MVPKILTACQELSVDVVKFVPTPKSQKIPTPILLSIGKAGHSGQEMMPIALDLIEKINNLPFRSQIKLCVDGGITSMNHNNFESEQIVSGSHILNAQNPKLQIMKLQTKSEYSN